MSASPFSLITGFAAPGALLPVRLPDLTPKQLAGLLLTPPLQLLVDCGGQRLPHPLGVCRFVAQLLQLRRRGTDIWLCQVHPGLRRYLHKLHLGGVFHLHEPALAVRASPAGLVALA